MVGDILVVVFLLPNMLCIQGCLYNRQTPGREERVPRRAQNRVVVPSQSTDDLRVYTRS